MVKTSYFLSLRGNLQSATLFILSTAAVFAQTKYYEISALLVHSDEKLFFTRIFQFVYIMLLSRTVTFVDVIGVLYYLSSIKIEMPSLFGQMTCALFY